MTVLNPSPYQAIILEIHDKLKEFEQKRAADGGASPTRFVWDTTSTAFRTGGGVLLTVMNTLKGLVAAMLACGVWS